MSDTIPVARPPDPDRPYVTGKPPVPEFSNGHKAGLALLILWTVLAIVHNDRDIAISAAVMWGIYALYRMWRA